MKTLIVIFTVLFICACSADNTPVNVTPPVTPAVLPTITLALNGGASVSHQYKQLIYTSQRGPQLTIINGSDTNRYTFDWVDLNGINHFSTTETTGTATVEFTNGGAVTVAYTIIAWSERNVLCFFNNDNGTCYGIEQLKTWATNN